MIDSRFYVLGLIVLALVPAGFARGETTLDVQVGRANVEVATATDGAFRLSVNYGGKVQPAASVYLAPNLSPAAATVVNEQGWTGLKASFGELLIDPVKGLWTLRDAAGKTLISAGPIGARTVNQESGKPFVLLHTGCASGKRFEVYGCGDVTDNLLQDHATPGVGNGHAVVPYYWSPAGYAALAVDGDDNAPPSWSASPALGRLTWIFSGESADLYLMPAASMVDASRAYANLIGRPPVPPRWTLGYLQSRWGWKDRAYIEDALQQFISRKLPVDAFIFDFEWYAKSPDYELRAAGEPTFTDFLFNPALFPEPEKQIAAMKASGVHFVGIRKPRLGNSELLSMARAKGWILPQGGSGENIDSRVLDYHNPAVREWYSKQMADLIRAGVDGWWDDEGEITYTTYYWWNQAEADALAMVDPRARLWTIDRAFAPGSQRFGAAAWTGDIRPTWGELAATPAHLLNWGLAGMPYAACDIGGFGGQTTPRLLTRWMEAGVFFPVMRSHSVNSATPHFPWLFGDDAEAAIRKALDLRYQLVPIYYSLAHEAHETGEPMMRPLAMEFPKDGRGANRSDEWFMGDSLLAAPILDDTDTRRVYLPAGNWYALGTTTPIKGGRSIDVHAKLDEIPVYVRAGSILVLGPVIQHTADLPGGPLEVQVYPGGDAGFTLVEDDGESTDYLKGKVRKTAFKWDEDGRVLRWSVDGDYSGKDVFTDASVELMDGSGKHGAGSLGTNGSVELGK